jgi:NhaC family Na+:H+ antiporter
MECLVLLLFCILLFGCLALGGSLLTALVLGFFLFAAYGLYRHFTLWQVLGMAWNGLGTIKVVFIVFLLIGMLTGLWRASGTIAYLITLVSSLIVPRYFLVLAFLLNSLVSFLMGTAFGTGATMGIITMSIGTALGVSPACTGGAILCGAYFGDRMSPVSTSALLVGALTDTDLYRNIRNMFTSALVPFLVSCALFCFLGRSVAEQAVSMELLSSFTEVFRFTPLLLLPALSLLTLAFFQVNVRKNMLVSIVLAALLCLTVQGNSPAEVLSVMVLGFKTPQPVLQKMLGGGGICSMVSVTAIVSLSSSYAGIFKETHMLDRIQKGIGRIDAALGPYPMTLLTASVLSLITCNQTLTTILSARLCSDFVPDRERFALYLENTAIILSPLVPWSIASAVILDTAGAPHRSIAFAFYLYLIPLWTLLTETLRYRSRRS